MTSQLHPDTLSVAIAGAGIAGLTAAIALRQHPKINVRIYERAQELREIGASIALGPNGLRTLERLGVHNALDDDVGFRGPSGSPMIYRHWQTNEIVSEDRFRNPPEHRHETTRFYRAHLQQALLEHVPKDIIHLSKKIVGAQASEENGVTIAFEDGTTEQADLLIGADGMNSAVRRAFLPSHKLSWTGAIFYRSVFDASLVEDIKDLPPDSTHWWGPTNTFFSSRLGKNKYTTVAAYTLDPTTPTSQTLSSQIHWDDIQNDLTPLRALYSNWNPVVRTLLSKTPTMQIYPNFSGPPLKTCVLHSRVTLIGDAAHTHGGAFAAGGSLAIDDAYALYLSLLHIFPIDAPTKPTAVQLVYTLGLYEKTRKPHTTRVLEAARRGNVAAVERARRRVEEGDEELRARIRGRGDSEWIHECDVARDFGRVVNGERERGGGARL
ncbi:MAG: hypothetical protein M1834_005227 [Cirrosporium novae-zelandiae]|nr:MAG: hypothetical protein M1834_005227 [Cirrosporium novae-zelandiae]